MSSYVEDSIETLIKHYATDLPAEALKVRVFTKEAIVSNNVCNIAERQYKLAAQRPS